MNNVQFYIQYETNIKKQIINNFKDQKGYYKINDFINSCRLNYKIDDKLYRQLIKNVLSKMYKNNEIYRIKKGLYTFSTEMYEMRNLIEEKQYINKYVIFDIYYDYLNEETEAIPTANNIYIDEQLFNNFSVGSLNMFFDHYKNMKKLKGISNFNNKQLLIFKIVIYLNNKNPFMFEELQKYIYKRMKLLDVNKEDIKAFIMKELKNNQWLIIKDKIKKEITRKIVRILENEK